MTRLSRPYLSLALVASLSLAAGPSLANRTDISAFGTGGPGGGPSVQTGGGEEGFSGIGAPAPSRCPAGTTARAIFDTDGDGHPIPASVQHVCEGMVAGAIAFATHTPGATRGDTFPPSEDELDLLCGDDNWIVIYEEDPQGVPIPGTYEPSCLD